MLKKNIFIFFLLFCFFLTGCSNWEDDEQLYDDLSEYYQQQQTEDDTATPSYPSEFSLPYNSTMTLDPITCSDGIQLTLSSLLYEGLYQLTPDFTAEPVLADTFSYDAENFTYRISLRGDVAFSDGSAVTAADVVSALTRAETSERYSSRFQHIVSVSEENNQVIIVLDASVPSFLSLLDIPVVKSGTESDLIPIGTGPYKFASSQLVCNEYWTGGSLPVSSINLVDCKDEDAVSYAYTSREVQLLVSDLIGTDALTYSSGTTFTDEPTSIMLFLGINTAKASLSRQDLRQALNLGINRESLVNAYLLGHGIAAQFPLSPLSSYYPTDLEDTYSLTAYQSAISSIAADEKSEINLTIIVNEENSFKVSLAQAIAQSLTTDGLSVTCESLPYSDYIARIDRGSYDLYLGEVKLNPNWNLQSLTEYSAINRSQYTNEDLQIAVANDAVSSERTRSVYHVCALLKQQVPLIPICFKNYSVMTTSDVVEKITPTASNPFYDLTQWTIHLN